MKKRYLFPLVIKTRKGLEKKISVRAMEALEQISNTMGAEIHDDLIQKLTIFSLSIDKLERSGPNPDEVDAITIKMRADFREMVSSVRNISRSLMPFVSLGDTFTRNIELLCENLDQPGQGYVHFESRGTEIQLTDFCKKYVHRIVQELIHNAFKHSSAWHVWVTMNWNGAGISIEVEDDGTSFQHIQELIELLKSKNNTLKMRSLAIGASLRYLKGKKGLLARLELAI